MFLIFFFLSVSFYFNVITAQFQKEKKKKFLFHNTSCLIVVTSRFFVLHPGICKGLCWNGVRTGSGIITIGL